jgi:tRNA nucleotidyltransferase/poly(A) polymerase
MKKTYLVGGAVRDKLRGKIPNDLDYVVVGATEKEMLADGFVHVGMSFPVFLHPVTGAEYALARTERKTGFGYTGFAVTFDPSITIESDLMRRDLTINSIAEDEDGNLVDPFGGQEDLKNGILRHTSPAFADDPLRVIRLARFAARFESFTIAQETVDLARKIVKSGEMESLTHERYWAEIEKVFVTPRHALTFFEVLYRFGVMDNVSFFYNLFNTAAAFWFAAGIETDKIAEEDKLMAFVALSSKAGAFEMVKSKSEFAEAARNLNLVWKNRADGYVTQPMVKFDVEQIFNVLKKIRGFDKQSTALKALLTVMTYGEYSGMKYHVSSTDLAKCAEAGQSVTSEAFQHLKGKEIGEWMDRLRKVKMVGALGEYA